MSRAASCQIMEEFQTDVVAPMEVFYYEQHRVRSSQECQEVGQGLKAAAFLLFGIEQCQRGRRSNIRKQVADIRKQREKRLCDLLYLGGRPGERVTGQEGAQQVQQRSVGNGVIGRKATALQKQKVVRSSIRFDLSHQA